MTYTRKPGQERTYYEGDVDFDALAEKDPAFAAICNTSKQKRWIDFQDPNVVQQLTKSLLKSDFGLSLELPDDRLCPPVPVRWNYIRWIQELLDTTSDTYSDRYDPKREVIGLDIGIGASCIYPLLACASRSEWRMAGTDIDQHSFDYARRNVESNGMNKRIKLTMSTPTGPLVPLEKLKLEELDFVMTNPPFYSSQEDMQTSYIGKDAAPSAVCTGAENEMICAGGDVGFVTRIIEESRRLLERVQWYTAMLGKLVSLQQVVTKLKEIGITNFAVTTLHAGFKTKRWAVAWSFQDYRPRNDVARHGELVLAVLPLPTAQTIVLTETKAVSIGQKVNETLKGLDVKWRWRASASEGVMEARENVWSRAARRKRQMGQAGKVAVDNPAIIRDQDSDKDGSEDEEPVALAVEIKCEDGAVQIRWLRGVDHAVFTSFSGMLKRTLTIGT